MPSSRWDRPSPPRDWRWVVGGIGRTMIATGLLMFGFVAYQLWGTGLEYAQAQDRLEEDFAALLAAGPDAPATSTLPSSTTTTTTTAAGPASNPSTTPATTAPATSAPPATGPSTAAPPGTAATNPGSGSTASPVTVPDFSAGDVIAYIEIPSIDLATYVVSGVQPEELKHGPGHYPDTPQPGQLGNSAIAGHRTTYGQPFYRLDEIAAGDEIVVTTVQGRFVYRATGSEVVAPERSDVIATTDPSLARLTLTTCDPKYTARNRLVVYADVDPAASAPPQPPVIQTEPVTSSPAAALPAPGAVVGTTDDPTITAVASTAATTATTPTTQPATTTSTSTRSTSTSVTGGGPGDTAADDELADAFAHGWFGDDAAFVQVALWGVVVSAIGLGAWLLSRGVRRDWVGALVGIVPFLVALYFFFQNVNRLLPAAL